MLVTRHLMVVTDFHSSKKYFYGYRQDRVWIPTFFKISSEETEEINSYRFGTRWGFVNDDRIFGWTIPLILQVKIWMFDIFWPHGGANVLIVFIRKKQESVQLISCTKAVYYHFNLQIKQQQAEAKFLGCFNQWLGQIWTNPTKSPYLTKPWVKPPSLFLVYKLISIIYKFKIVILFWTNKLLF